MDMTNTTKKKRNRFFCLIIVFLAFVLGGVLFLAFNKDKIEVFNQQEEDYHTLVYNNKKYTYNTSIVPILLLGIDTDSQELVGQADVIEMMLLDRKNKEINLISIPRDTMTEIRFFDVSGNDLGWNRQHLNLAYAYGKTPASGCMYTSQAVSRLFNGIPMARYAALNLNMLSTVHDVVGTLEIEVPNDSLVGSELNWHQGEIVEITSKNVETYLRDRNTDMNFSNVERMERQKAYLIAYFNTLKEHLNKDFDNTVAKMYNVINEVNTNISLHDIEDFASMVLEFKFDASENFFTLEGVNQVGKLHDEFEIDQDLLNQRLIEWFYEKED